MAVSRALSVAHMSANLRRSLHNDLKEPSFRSNLDRYLGMFSSLVEEEWNTFKERQTFTTGHNLDIMFADRSAETLLILGNDPEPSENPPNFRERLGHFMSVTKKGGYYAIPSKDQSTSGSTTYICFQLLGFRPGNKKYIERITQWSTDDWKGNLCCAVLGAFDIPKEGGQEGLRTVPEGFAFTSMSSSVQPISVDDFFQKDMIDYMHEFRNVSHATKFDKHAIEEMAEDSCSDQSSHLGQGLLILALFWTRRFLSFPCHHI